ncbi:MAG TPA: RAMP superfamily CRISPR-associated protein [Thermoanaerobaculia bacterium]
MSERPPTHSPYGFVPLPAAGPERAPFPGWHRDGGVSGVLACDLVALGPLFTADHRTEQHVAPGDRRLLLGFLRDGDGRPIIQGASLRGMLRAVFEAAFPSCLPLAAGRGISKRAGEPLPYRLEVPPAYRHESCGDIRQLCPACRLFGVIQGDEVHAASRVRVSDAALAQGAALTAETVRLGELSSPKPHHYPAYSATGGEGGPIRGRKLYVHHDPLPAPGVEAGKWSDRSHAIREYAAAGTRFEFRVHLHNLTEEEVCRVLACLQLDAEHAHKLGMAKPLGYGSCAVEVRAGDSHLGSAADRYRSEGRTGGFAAERWPQPAGWLHGELEELLRRTRPPGAVTGYLPFRDYRGMGIDRHGKYVPVARHAAGGGGQSPSGRPAGDAGGRSAVLAALAALSREGRAGGAGTPATPAQRRKNDKIKIEVVAAEGDGFRLRDVETGAEILFTPRVPTPWKPGNRRTVRVERVDEQGTVLQVKV